MSDNTKADLRAAAILVGDILAGGEDEAIAQRVRDEQAARQESREQRHARGWFLVAELVRMHATQRGWSDEMRAAAERAALVAAGDGSLPVRAFPEGFAAPAESVLRWCEVPDFNAWLLSRGVKPLMLPQAATHAPSASASPAGLPEAATKPFPRQRHQEAEILRVLRELGHDPAALPRNDDGKPGPKAAVRERLGHLPRWGGTIFDKAWERLRASGDIKDA